MKTTGVGGGVGGGVGEVGVNMGNKAVSSPALFHFLLFSLRQFTDDPD